MNMKTRLPIIIFTCLALSLSAIAQDKPATAPLTHDHHTHKHNPPAQDRPPQRTDPLPHQPRGRKARPPR